jgi:hypothetical protein
MCGCYFGTTLMLMATALLQELWDPRVAVTQQETACLAVKVGVLLAHWLAKVAATCEYSLVTQVECGSLAVSAARLCVCGISSAVRKLRRAVVASCTTWHA